MGFDELWDGFDKVTSKIHTGDQFSAQLSKFAKKRADIERTYGEALLKLSKSFEKDLEIASAHTAWACITAELGVNAQAHIDLSEKLTSDIVTPIQNFLRGEEKKKKSTLISNGQKLVKELQKNETSMEQASAKYRKFRKTQEKSQEDLDKAQQAQGNVAKFQKKLEGDKKKADKADSDYTATVNTLKTCQDKFYDHEMPKILQDMEQCELERLTNTKKWFTRYCELDAEIGPLAVSSADKQRNTVEAVDIQADLDSFVSSNRPAGPPPARAQYVPHTQPDTSSENNYGASSLAPAAQTDKKPKGKSPASKKKHIRKSKKAEKNVKTDNAEKSSVTIVSSPQTSTYSPSAPVGDTKAAKPEAKVEVSVSTPAATNGTSGGAGEKVELRCIYEYEAQEDNELTMKEDDIIILLEKDESGWWRGELNGNVGVFPCNFVEVVGEESDNNTKKIAPQTKCKVLYAYEAEDETELTIEEGDEITIEYEDEGWYFGENQKGEKGNFPSNYVELL